MNRILSISELEAKNDSLEGELEHTRAVLKDCLATVQELAVYDADFYKQLPARVADIRDAIGDKPVVSLREENERLRKALEAIASAKWAVWASGVARKALGKEDV